MINTELKTREYVENRIKEITQELDDIYYGKKICSNENVYFDLSIRKEELVGVLEILKGNYEI